jgi:glycosyltransferase involved in cell wall biosynthesis
VNSGESCGEVIVVDDGSTDDTRDVVAAISDSRVRYFYSDSKGGPAARNLGFRAASNDLIKFLDDDDFLVPGALTGQLADFWQLDSRSQTRTVIYGDVLVTSRLTGHLVGREIPARRKKGESDVEYLTRVNVLTSCPLHQRHLLEEVGGFDESLSSSQEKDLHLRLALQGVGFLYRPRNVYVLDNTSARDRITTQQVGRTSLEFRISLLEKRVKLLSEFFDGQLPLGVRRTLARDFRECQRWARSAGFGSLEQTCVEQATNLYPGGPFERHFSGYSAYGMSRRVRVKAAKRIRGWFSRSRQS